MSKVDVVVTRILNLGSGLSIYYVVQWSDMCEAQPRVPIRDSL